MYSERICNDLSTHHEGLQPADTDVALDERRFIEALLPLQDTMHLPTEAETAWRELLVTGYDLCCAPP